MYDCRGRNGHILHSEIALLNFQDTCRCLDSLRKKYNFQKRKCMNEVDQYIDTFDDEVKARLLRLREIIKAEVPNAQEGIMYGLVGYKLNKKPLVYFGGFTHHIGFYATPEVHESFAKELSKYKQGKGSVQFPHAQPLPEELVAKMVRSKQRQIKG